MKEVIENILDNNVPLRIKENQVKQEIIINLLNKLKEEENSNGNK